MSRDIMQANCLKKMLPKKFLELDNSKVVPLMNNLNRNEWRHFYNFFLPSVKLMEKERKGSNTIKKHDAPKTPYQRIMESKHVGKDVKLS